MSALLVAATAAAQPVLDCGQAKTAAEKAVCGNPELAAADKAMAQAYAALRMQLPPEQQQALLADQRRWIARRAAACGDKSEDASIKCLVAQTEARRRFLAGEGPNGATGSPRIVPGLFHEARKGRYEISIEYPQMLTPRGAAADAFERAAHEIVFGKDLVKEYREMERPMAAGAENFYEAGYEVAYADPRLVSVVFSIGTYTGGAHANSGRSSLIFDLTAGRPLAVADLVANPETAVEDVSRRCRAEAEKEDWGLFDDPDFPAVVKDVSSWAVEKDGIKILFDPYAVTPYAAGSHECRLSYGELAPLLKSDGLLPPR
ncbi:MAG TPA: lysozyme inhibitor LprI family protein [Stellaceae bacterium]